MRKSASLEFRTSQSPLDLNNDDGFDFPGTILPNKYEVLSMPHMEERKCCNCFYCTPMLKLLDWMEPSACRRWGVVLCMISTGVVAGVLIGLFAPSWGPAASMNSNSGGNESNDATINDTTAVTQGNESGSNGTVGMIPSSMPSPSILPSNTSYAPSPFDMASLPTLQQGPPPPLLDRKDALLSLLLQSSKVPSQSLSYAQYQATMWMIQDDPLYLNPNTNQTQYIIERYVLVLLYMSMGGIGKSNGGQWVNSAGFLSELTTCDWMGVTCKEDGIVIEMIIFGTLFVCGVFLSICFAIAVCVPYVLRLLADGNVTLTTLTFCFPSLYIQCHPPPLSISLYIQKTMDYPHPYHPNFHSSPPSNT
uniref:Uncharacterized protein n=1 Tax=Ditylum brightwellii TaxID=49249 RepID=A0A7S4VJQ7_9STRA